MALNPVARRRFDAVRIASTFGWTKTGLLGIGEDECRRALSSGLKTSQRLRLELTEFCKENLAVVDKIRVSLIRRLISGSLPTASRVNLRLRGVAGGSAHADYDRCCFLT